MAAGGYLFQELLDRKILVRNYSRNPRLHGGLRITVGKAEENPQIIGAIRDIIQ